MKNEPLHLLILEDEAAHVEAIRRAFDLAANKPDVQAVGTLREYRERIAMQPPDLALVDLNLPDGRATELLTHPAADAPFPILVMTAFGNEQIVVEVMKSGALDYVVKSPEAFAAMPQTVARALREWQLLQQQKLAAVALRQANRLYATLSQISLTMMHASSQEELLRTICHDVVEFGQFRMAWIGLVDASGGRLVPVCHDGFEDGYLKKITIPLGPENPQGPSSLAIAPGEIVINNDTQTNPEMIPWREAALERGYRASATVPFRCQGKIIGALSLYEGEPGFFSAEEKQLLAQIGKAISYSLDALAEQAGRKVVEVAVIASENRYRRLFEAAKDGILILNAETGRILDVNPFLTELLGYARETFIGKHLWELGFFKDIAASDAHFKELQAKDYIRYDDLPMKTSDGRRIEVEFVSNAYLVNQYRVMQCNIRDITGRKRSEASLARLVMAVEQAAETIVITDTEGTMLYANPAFEKTTGYTRAEALGQNPRVLKSGRQDAEFYRQMWATIQRGEVWHGHFSNKRKDGKLFDEEATISPVRDATGKVVNYVAVKRDVTREMELEAQFRQAQKMEAIGQLAGGVAHDFNNLLAAIQMETDLLKFDGELSPDQSELVNAIAASVQRATAMTRQLLLFSRREVFQPGDLDVNEAVATTAKMLKRMLGETIEMQLKLAAAPLFVHADAGMLDQVLMNLCVNARDAMPGGGQLVLTTAGVELDELAVAQCVHARPGSFVCLSVSDNGGGIAPEILPQIFEPFFTTKAVGKGTGLGLATVFSIVQQHQGWINAYSEPGHGTTFRIYLPRLTGSIMLKSAPPLAALRGGPETILLAEDDPALRLAVGKILVQLGYHILEAPNGIKALEVWQKHCGEISLLLTDLVMPDGMTGRDLALSLLQKNPKLKVIYMSGYSAEAVSKDFSFAEDVNFLTKPFPAHKLAQTIRDCLDVHS